MYPKELGTVRKQMIGFKILYYTGNRIHRMYISVTKMTINSVIF